MIFRLVARQPVLPRLDLAAQRRWTMWRRQRTIVSGVTSSRSPWRHALGITLSKAASRSRSAQFTCGRRSCRRCSTASWWRRIKISAVFHASSRWDSRSHMVTRVMRRKTNCRHMTGDHHGQGVGRAKLAGRAVDAILSHSQALPGSGLAGGLVDGVNLLVSEHGGCYSQPVRYRQGYSRLAAFPWRCARLRRRCAGRTTAASCSMRWSRRYAPASCSSTTGMDLRGAAAAAGLGYRIGERRSMRCAPARPGRQRDAGLAGQPGAPVGGPAHRPAAHRRTRSTALVGPARCPHRPARWLGCRPSWPTDR